MIGVSNTAPEWSVQLFITGDSEQTRAVCKRVSASVETALSPPSRLEIIDVLDKPELADRTGIIVTPTLVIRPPAAASERRLVGDLSDAAKLRLVLSDSGTN